MLHHAMHYLYMFMHEVCEHCGLLNTHIYYLVYAWIHGYVDGLTYSYYSMVLWTLVHLSVSCTHSLTLYTTLLEGLMQTPNPYIHYLGNNLSRHSCSMVALEVCTSYHIISTSMGIYMTSPCSLGVCLVIYMQLCLKLMLFPEFIVCVYGVLATTHIHNIRCNV